MTYAIHKAAYEQVQAELDAAIKMFPVCEKGPMGLTPDAVKATPEWQAAYKASNKARNAARKYAAFMTKNYSKEMRADREAARVDKFSALASA